MPPRGERTARVSRRTQERHGRGGTCGRGRAGCAACDQYSPSTFPSPELPRFRHVCRLIPFAMKWTLPSQKTVFTPLACRLRADWIVGYALEFRTQGGFGG